MSYLKDKITSTLRKLKPNEVYLFTHNSSGDAGDIASSKPFKSAKKVADEVSGHVYSRPIIESINSEGVYIMQRGSTTEVSISELE